MASYLDRQYWEGYLVAVGLMGIILWGLTSMVALINADDYQYNVTYVKSGFSEAYLEENGLDDQADPDANSGRKIASPLFVMAYEGMKLSLVYTLIAASIVFIRRTIRERHEHQ